MMLDGALVDTSFLISLVKPAEANHGAAKSYYKGCLERQIPLYLSTIVISEFTVKQAVTDPGLRNYFVLPFNIDHAIKVRAAGQLATLPIVLRDGYDEAWFTNGQRGLNI